ncbi:MAG TPA: HEPN domain-containing protein [Ramlibacter sp.]|uniref:HEPN domain-containing protein n=1 Tax=Ramlibacter sp. TaxID=1917967 RepID=UPI002B9E23ED|nr:HEPN domain-containing protein [Ramlibacter sp.]HVZ46350.1 HEPN domain-containing protein [Ramlibacter sp.]
MNAKQWIGKARVAAESAQLLFEHGDSDGACNRAYYAMFSAARAALEIAGGAFRAEQLKTHSGLISAFSMRLVKTGLVSHDLGRTLNKAEDLRLASDYRGDAVKPELAEWAVQSATEFVAAIDAAFFPSS